MRTLDLVESMLVANKWHRWGLVELVGWVLGAVMSDKLSKQETLEKIANFEFR